MRMLILIVACFSAFIANAQTIATISANEHESLPANESVEPANKNARAIIREDKIKRHKRKVKLTLIVDSLVLSDKSFCTAKIWTTKIRFETGYLNIHDNVFVKIFIARNVEYGKRFYSWKWDYYKKDNDVCKKVGSSFYSLIRYKYDYYYSKAGAIGQGIGTQGTSGYLMIYYRYRLD